MTHGFYAAETDDSVHINDLADAVENSLETLYPGAHVVTEEKEKSVYHTDVDMEQLETVCFQFYPRTQRSAQYFEDADGAGDVIWNDDEPDAVTPGYNVEAHPDGCTVSVSFSASEGSEKTNGYYTILHVDEPYSLTDRIGAFVGLKEFPDDDECQAVVDTLDRLEPELTDRLETDVERSNDMYYVDQE